MNRKKEEKALKLLMELYKEIMPKELHLVENKERLQEAKFAINTIVEYVLLNDEEAKPKLRTDSLMGTTLILTITANMIVVDAMLDEFCEAIKIADTFEVTPLTDGKIDLGLTFQNCYTML